MIQALGKNLIVRPVKEEKKDKIIITSKEERPVYWEVLSIGKEIEDIAVGEHVCTHQYGMHEVQYGEEKAFLVAIENVYGKKKV